MMMMISSSITFCIPLIWILFVHTEEEATTKIIETVVAAAAAIEKKRKQNLFFFNPSILQAKLYFTQTNKENGCNPIPTTASILFLRWRLAAATNMAGAYWWRWVCMGWLID
jgi:hypothetical protein